MTRTIALFAAAAVLLSASQAGAVACRDANGKFIACPAAKPDAKAGPCRDSSGKFTKCPVSKSSAANTMSAAPAAKTAKK